MNKVIILFFLIFSYSSAFTRTDHLLFTAKPSNLYKSGNVYQGITKWNNIWIVSQTDKNKKIIFSFLDNNGNIIYNQVINYPSHGQDLSVLPDKKNNNIFYLITSSKNNEGIAIFKVNMTKNKKIEFLFDKYLSKGFNAVTLSYDKNYILVKNYNRIYIYRVFDIFDKSNKSPLPIFSFFLNKLQQREVFQGIDKCGNYIFALTGNNRINGEKYLFIYDSYGKLLKKYNLTTGKKFAELKEGKWELEGLYCDDKYLYTSVMSGMDGHNTKQIFRILIIK